MQANNNNNKQAELIETLSTMCRQEAQYVAQDYLFQSQDPDHDMSMTAGPQHDSLDIDMDCRTKMAQWCYKVIEFCRFDRETASIAMNILDRFMSSPQAQAAKADRRVYQLAAMTSLYTAVKIHEPEAMDPALIAKISHGTYSEQEVEAMELQILMGVSWRVNTPTALAFTRLCLELLSTTCNDDDDDDNAIDEFALETIYHLVKIQSESATLEYDFMAVPPSLVAYSSIINAMTALGLDDETVNHAWATLAQALSTTMNVVDRELIGNAQNFLYQALEEPEAREIIQTCNPQYNSVDNNDDDDDDCMHDDDNVMDNVKSSYSPSTSPRCVSAKAI